MPTIIEKYIEKCHTPTDINRLLPIIKSYAENCKHITEMGVRSVNSTWALLAGYPDTMVSYDIEHNPNIEEVELAAKTACIDFRFIESDVLQIQIHETDLLFLDTYHHYYQLYNELKKHSNRVNKYILIHDTTAYRKKNARMSSRYLSVMYSLRKQIEKFETCEKRGLMPAIRDFLRENRQWIIKRRYFRNNGLTVLQNKTKMQS